MPTIFGASSTSPTQRLLERSKRPLAEGRLWPQPLLQFNPAYEKVGTVEKVVESGLLHDDIRHIFDGYSLYRHQKEAIGLGVAGTDFVVTSGTGSGKSLTYIATIFNHLLSTEGSEGVVAVIVYPMNALINSQTNEFDSYKHNYERNTKRTFPVTYNQYTGQEREERREGMRKEPPQILLTNYMMLELLLTRVRERPIRDAIFENLRYLVFDELHTYRGRQGADVAMLIRRIQAQCKRPICCIGTSATMVSVGSSESRRWDVARVAETVFGRPFVPDQIIDETLARSLDDAGTLPSRQELHAAIAEGIDVDSGEAALRTHPLAVWLENRVALEERDGQLARRIPMGFTSVVEALAEESGASLTECRGGQALSRTYGHAFCECMKWRYAPTGLSELVVYFLRRIHDLLRDGGFTAIITINSIIDGDVRKDGLEQIVSTGAQINMAVRGTKWPGTANLVVSLLAIHKGNGSVRGCLTTGRSR